ncbi:MAG: DUF3465 domain-containing protein [Candidatus Sericytochromatia bacterium]|nr:DUF3465 domain-containing protein [Candidatus Sericytochromatia bacterium]
MNRNPAFILTIALMLGLQGCGTASASWGVSASASALEALRKKKGHTQPPSRANKDWKVLNGTVTKLLPDDNLGNRHQHFLVSVQGRYIKVAHNLELAPKVPVAVGEPVEVKCEYIRSNPYDVAHWTHYDPKGGEGGYIKYRGRVYDRPSAN